MPDAADSRGSADTSLTTHAYALREGLVFPSGREATARDVKHSFDRMPGIAAGVGPAALFPTLRSVTAQDRGIVFDVREDVPTAERAVRRAVAALVDRDGIAGGPYHSTVEPLYSLTPRGFVGRGAPSFDRRPDGDRAGAVDDSKEIRARVAEDVPLVPLRQKKDYVLSSPDVTGSPCLSDGTGLWRLRQLDWP